MIDKNNMYKSFLIKPIDIPMGKKYQVLLFRIHVYCIVINSNVMSCVNNITVDGLQCMFIVLLRNYNHNNILL